MYVGPILECTSGGASNVHLGIPRTYIRGSLQRTSEKHSVPYVRDLHCACFRGRCGRERDVCKRSREDVRYWMESRSITQEYRFVYAIHLDMEADLVRQ